MDSKPGKNLWKKSTAELITYFIEKFTWYDTYIFKDALAAIGFPVVSPDDQTMIFLQSSVFHIPELYSVALTQTQLDTHLVSTESFDQYSIATHHDQSCRTTPNITCKNAVSVYHPEIGIDVCPYPTGDMVDLVSDKSDKISTNH